MLKKDLKNAVINLDRKVAKSERENLTTTDYPVGKGRGRPKMKTLPVRDEDIFHPDMVSFQPKSFKTGAGLTDWLFEKLTGRPKTKEEKQISQTISSLTPKTFGFGSCSKCGKGYRKGTKKLLDDVAPQGLSVEKEVVVKPKRKGGAMIEGGRKAQHGNKGKTGNKWIQFLKKEGYLQKGVNTGICLPKKDTPEYTELMRKYRGQPSVRKSTRTKKTPNRFSQIDSQIGKGMETPMF